MSGDTERTRRDNITVARQFFTAHKAYFAAASSENNTENRHFDFTPEQFDDWAVGAGHMPKTVRDANGQIEHDGLVQCRYQLRHRINIAARQGEGLERGFSIEARAKRWRVVLAERYFQEQPREDGDMISRVYNYVGRKAARRKKQIINVDHLDEDQKLNIRAQDAYLTQYAFWNAQHINTLKLRLDPNSQEPDMRKLARDMGKLVSDAFLGTSGKKPQPRLPNT